ncbi:BQ5605_C005g03434 [Microbotryum silenes-dioicae]|uniref:BQ5605_C005g03434 protein n=1 Tax=Microbotryum silenes-dioicae TaxID=796604 RepID=A0A2X0MXS4_9BASI|nr:BQ5605_C005g03434 [Microbotryum silenes-dioicae]
MIINPVVGGSGGVTGRIGRAGRCYDSRASGVAVVVVHQIDTVAKFYSAAIGARPAAKPGNATIAPSTDAASSPLMHDIANCVIMKNPSTTSFDQDLLALDKHYPALACATACVIKSQSAVADLDTLIAKGLPIGRITCLIEKLFTSTEGGVIQCTLTGFFSSATRHMSNWANQPIIS